MQENKMGVMPVKKLIVSMSLPMMISMLVQALYNIADSMFVTWYDTDAMTGLTLAFPLQNLMIAVAAGTGVGINALLSRSLGERNAERANQAANTGLFLTFISYLVFLVIGLTVAKPFIEFTASSSMEAEYGSTYITICCTLSIGLFFQVMLERLLQSTGRTFYSMISQMTGALINIALDPILIFGCFGVPSMGVAGAAYATVFSQMVASLVSLFLNLKCNSDIKLSFNMILHPVKEVVKEIYAVGVPSILMMSIGSVMTALLNLILGQFPGAVTVFGVYFRMQSFFFMPIFGLNNGLIPVLAYNYGAKNADRIKQALRFAITLAITIMAIGTVCFEIFPGLLLKIFNANETMMTTGVPALRTIALHFPIAAVCIVLGSIFQAFSQSIYSLIISLFRQLIALIPAAFLLSLSGNVHMVWWAFPIAEIVSLTLSTIFFKKVYSKTVVPMEKEAAK